jgi:hypothetical protein
MKRTSIASALLISCVAAIVITTQPGWATALQVDRPAIRPSELQTTTVTFLEVHGASPGGFASVTVRTTPNANCSITYVNPRGATSKSAGLINQPSDSDGKVTWLWKIGPNSLLGRGSVTVTCNGASATAPIYIVAPPTTQ